jgi:hypothetical protein
MMNAVITKKHDSSLVMSMSIILFTIFITPMIVVPISEVLGSIIQIMPLSFSIIILFLVVYFFGFSSFKLITRWLIKMHCEKLVLRLGLCNNCSDINCSTTLLSCYLTLLCVSLLIILASFIYLAHSVVGSFINIFY